MLDLGMAVIDDAWDNAAEMGIRIQCSAEYFNLTLWCGDFN